MHVSIFSFDLYKPTISLYDRPSTTADTIPHIKTEDVIMCRMVGASTDLRGSDICAWSNGGMVTGRGNPESLYVPKILYDVTKV
jgi:hypothetical protein